MIPAGTKLRKEVSDNNGNNTGPQILIQVEFQDSEMFRLMDMTCPILCISQGPDTNSNWYSKTYK